MLQEVNLRGAVLTGAGMRRAYLGRSDLERARLRGADLRRAVIVETNLRGADLSGARLRHVTWSDAVCPDGTQSADTRSGTCRRHLTPTTS